ncbi:hypothetical protein Vadar_009652 [Vaccinium darrowii]|uniref:Uncharacterized protein n=1 Tax=Vaccinium darrowii TaxID=229202 RepID=A0ACB7XPF3_9ERIC|nr:hypothetical protein Vadar_009652 [Vaccinium darrowii]
MGRSKRKASRNTSTATATATAAAVVSISDLPNHITCDILSRLPLNSIFICKRVCKIWRTIILEPYFAKLHRSRSPLSLIFYRNGTERNNDNSPSSHFEILQLYDPPVKSRRNATMKFTTEIYFPHVNIQIVDSCNGLVLLSNYSSYIDDHVIVCNPLRAQHLVLPKPPKHALRDSYIELGFGHSPVTDQYKVVRLTHVYSIPARLYCDIYTIGIDDEWRSIGDIGQPPFYLVSRLFFLNGALHWLGHEDSWFICYFDIEKEQFGSFPLPSEFGETFLHLGVVDNWLYVRNDHSVGPCKFWVMKDYGDFGSWTLEWVIEGPLTHRFNGPVKPLKMLKDGTLLMMLTSCNPPTNLSEATLASYNPQTRVLKEKKYCGILPQGDSVADVPCFFSPMDALK